MLQQTKPDLQLFIDRLTSRSALSESECAAILALPSKTATFSANHDIVRLGEHVDHATFIVDGLVARFDQDALGVRQITALHIEGDMPDLLSVVQPNAATGLQALSNVTILKVPHSALKKLASDYPAIAEALWRDTSVDAVILAEWIMNIGRREAKKRIAHLLCEMASRYGCNPDEARFYRLKMTQTHLADATGLTPVHVNRCLQALKAEGVIFRNKTVRISSWDHLVEVADFDAAYLQMA